MGRKRDPQREYETMRHAFEIMDPTLPEDLDEWIREEAMPCSKYLFCRRKKGVRYGYCTHCDKESKLDVTGEREYTTEQLENSQTKHNDYGYCPNCNSRVQFKDAGRSHQYLINYADICIIQPTADGDAQMRCFHAVHDLRGAYINVPLKLREEQRYYFDAGTGTPQEYRVQWSANPQNKPYALPVKPEESCLYLGRHSVPDKRADEAKYLNNYVWQPAASVCAPFFWMQRKDIHYYGITTPRSMLAGTSLRYCSAELYRGSNYAGYLALYCKHPALVERLAKEGQDWAIYDAVERRLKHSGVINWRKDTVPGALGLGRAELATVKALGDGISCNPVVNIQAAQLLKRHRITVTVEQLLRLKPALEAAWGWEKRQKECLKQLDTCLDYTTLHRLFKYLERGKTKGVRFGDYADYIQQCRALKLDLAQAYILYPKDFERAHQNTTELLAAIKDAQEREAAKQIDEQFGLRYKKLYKRYQYASKDYLIRPAHGKQELKYEGASLGHCVYTNYADRYIQGRTIILLIRRREYPETPYYTMEITEQGSIIQCRGKRNCAPTPEVQAFVDEWKAWLSKPQAEKQQETARAVISVA